MHSLHHVLVVAWFEQKSHPQQTKEKPEARLRSSAAEYSRCLLVTEAYSPWGWRSLVRAPQDLASSRNPCTTGMRVVSVCMFSVPAGVFDWLQQQGRLAALVRQISNPMAGVDTTLLALAGTGFSSRRAFGFMSCERVVGAAEGMNVLRVGLWCSA